MNKRLDIPFISVEEYASPSSVFADEDTPLEVVYQNMQSMGIRHIPVLKNGKAVGLISDRDLRAISSVDLLKDFKAKDIMIKNPFCVQSQSSLADVAFEMSKNKYGSALIADDNGKITGIFTCTDALNALNEILRGQLPE